MKRKIIILLFLSILMFLGSRQINRYIALENSDVIVRIAYRGLDNLFHVPLEYYAINSERACKIPKDMIKKRFGEEVKTREKYSEGEDAAYWLVHLEYREYGENLLVKQNEFIETSLGERHRVTYSSHGNNEVASDEEISVMIQVAEKLYEEYPPEKVDSETHSFCILNFMMIHRGDQYLIADNVGKNLRRISEDGSVIKVMDLPNGGQFDYYYFYGE